ncbi:MAG: hypothetical protein A3G00_02820 [Candidatus Magasanikbacteria bacterium RIFCSPLOWO2_12_FULL_43_12]|uniref:Lipoprotein n=1 Tax=Candidatus Magasanikbacteria bacterium RIFCSPLOWO2_12_FULL_43_12 TaxID=1798692 RepID=A0A1F6MRC7_9BACT|nr:MAG: hypothetical protein A3I93_00355 [Candidatus Magasanikbacteria bacterium RIFCSPLOWO2_02_FULL_43_22]OGH72027.1 MAG: hypothetical protein A3C74_01140 [Candidatus Magasanikbacteria bacterium RIFCSPHIGHO2_02_FULL_44_13]OGH74225.1 MAG: hypothetical protein A3G00_02820 [Candidatus Magasanikbacteria bacterium RIFCSPLOWO2_12_FULL_43_12]
MRRYIFLFSLFAVVLIASGCWFKPADDLAKSNDSNKIEEAGKQPDCLFQLDIHRDDNAFKEKNFGDKINVDDQRFSELALLDATKPKEYADGGGEQVGKLVNLSGVDYQDAAIYLVKNQVLKTYVHLGSKVCLVEENTDKLDTLYAAHFIGTHEFCTNECETEELDFRVMIEKDSGFIYLAK